MSDTKFDDDGINDDELLAACLEENQLQEVETKVDDAFIDVPTESFGFPFTPYPIQIEFMKGLYRTLQRKQHGIFESPTGTGKSLSLICGSLRWLFDEIKSWKNEYEELLKPVEMKIDPNDDWLKRIMKKREEETKREKRRDELKMKIDLEEQYEKEAKNKISGSIKKTKRNFDAKYLDTSKETPIETEEQMSDDELVIKDDQCQFNIDQFESPTKKTETENKKHVLKIFFCTRTHSQISQFIGEIQKTKYADHLRLVALASRQNLCINESVLKLKSLSVINERCLDLQKEKKEKKTSQGKRQKTGCGCPYLQQDRVECLSNDILGEVQDIEDVVKLGRELNACPYYATRAAIAGAHLVVLPYQTLIHKSTRDACGIELKNNVVIIDEAHNLPDAICAMHSSEITGQQLIDSYGQLSLYHEKYRTRLTAKNLLTIKQLLEVHRSLLKSFFLNSQENLPNNYDYEKWNQLKVLSTNQEKCSTFDLIDFLSDAGIHMNLFQLIDYIKNNELTKKLNGFMRKYPVSTNEMTETCEKKNSESALKKLLQKRTTEEEKENFESQKNVRISNSFIIFNSFLESLTNRREDGKLIVVLKETLGECSLKFFAMRTSSFFHDLVNETRSVIVAGGTMRPINEFLDELFLACGQSEEKIFQLSCGHIVPAENVLALSLPSGPTNVEFDFVAANRSNSSMLDELGRVLVSLCNLVPDGLVVFFCSYDHLQKSYKHFEKNSFLKEICSKKKIFVESKKSNDVENVLTNYTKAIKSGQGGILFSIVGGKMSEGINFSDELARCVCVVGLPYANIGAAEIVEKIRYLDSMKSSISSKETTPGRSYYENTCWKAINQSIGRAIRHRADFASLLLIDKRYNRANISTKLPKWLANSFQQIHQFSQAANAVEQFFIQRKSQIQQFK